jgi:hypothetical protein
MITLLNENSNNYICLLIICLYFIIMNSFHLKKKQGLFNGRNIKILILVCKTRLSNSLIEYFI